MQQPECCTLQAHACGRGPPQSKHKDGCAECMHPNTSRKVVKSPLDSPRHGLAMPFPYPAQLVKLITQGFVAVFLTCSAVRKVLSTPGPRKKLPVVHFGLLLKCAYPLQVLQPPCKNHVSELSQHASCCKPAICCESCVGSRIWPGQLCNGGG